MPLVGRETMARFKHYDYGQAKMLPVRFEKQILPGTFAYMLARVIETSASTSRSSRRAIAH